ncbi:MAG: type 4a pilus biogenesis protein PilO [Patescibacteria group bacterium]
MKNFSKREKKLAYLTILVVAFAFILNVIVIPLKHSWISLERDIEMKKLALERYDDLLKRGQNKGFINFSDTKKYKSDVEVLNDLFSLVDKISNKSSIDLISIRPSGKEKKDELVKYSLEIKIEGTFKNILIFIENTSKTNSNFLVEQLEIAKSNQSSALSARLIISKFVVI